MARKSKKDAVKPTKGMPQNAHIIGSGEVEQQLITDTLRESARELLDHAVSYHSENNKSN